MRSLFTRSIMTGVLALWCLVTAQSAMALDEKDLLPPNEAFKASVERIDANTLNVHFTIAPGYHLYKDRISFTPQPAQPVTPALPKGQVVNDPNFGKVEIYPQSVDVRLTSSQPWPQTPHLTVRMQGCADAGVCYPPQTVQLTPPTDNASHMDKPGQSGVKQLFGGPTENTTLAGNDSDAGGTSGFFRSSLAATVGLFFLAGIGLSLTACMYPLLPIVSGIVIGQNKSRWQAFGLTFVYVQGIALTYTVVGIAAASTGTLLTVQLQSSITVVVITLFFVAMAASMFGLFELQMPGGFQSRVNELANRLPGGKLAPVFVMGILSALLVGACMAPPLFGALAYMARTGDLALGGGALYALGLGTGLPLLLIGAFGATVLPRLSGKAMTNVKRVFGVILLGTAVWVSHPLWYKPASNGFQKVATNAELDAAVAAAHGKPVLLDFYADWCVSCLEFNRNVLPDPAVKAQLANFVLLQADVTRNTPDDAALLKRFGLYGPPAMLFYNRDGELQKRRVIGDPTAAGFAATLQQLVQGNTLQ
ncbi:thiol:disulfide interchange protein DsbD [Silvimonas terrae]|uniref:Thiol:disulfide interchange protein DsbD n=1 Tax=Silvimonas terrae TaxID=300266 RepID=A0A840RG15_9NEIS|nr:protein-disulfide reductase DsbD [Silvimonas terrae]MBB5191524.1 thiol:disulfide interchange protein DsbD [Silvimonas terrae]